jgi:predicted nucleic acid-binding protein
VEHHVTTQEALQKLREIVALPGHSFWVEPANGYSNNEFVKTLANTLTHSLVTDGYLATVAACHDGKLATLDRQLVRIFGDLAVAI